MTWLRYQRLRILLFLLCLGFFFFLPARYPHQSSLEGTYQYFKEVTFTTRSKRIGAGNKCDARFAPEHGLTEYETHRSLSALLDTYVTTMRQLDLVTWIAHGALIGYHWNRELLPWDTDIDAQVRIETLAALAPYNMTEYNYTVFDGEAPRSYLLDINPYFNNTSTEDVANVISGRWIDKTSGKYLDITAIYTTSASNIIAYCKDGHQYLLDDLFPLQQVHLGKSQVMIPFNYKKLLQEEYGSKVLTKSRFHWYIKSIEL